MNYKKREDYPYLSGDHIKVRYMPLASSTAYMVLEHYDKPEYEDTIFVINTWDDKATAAKYLIGSKYIFYQMEHFPMGGQYVDETIKRMDTYDEVWDIDILNIRIYPEATRKKVKFMPLRYASIFDDLTIKQNPSPRFDWLFCGVCSPHRQEIIGWLAANFELNKGMFVFGHKQTNIPDLLADARFMLNLHQADEQHTIQEQVRIYELLSMGMPVISEYSIINYFGDLITECDMYNLPAVLKVADQSSKKERYKRLTFTDETFEAYRQDLLMMNPI